MGQARSLPQSCKEILAMKNNYWSDLATWGEFFAKYGKRYGLMREFHENGIC